MKMRCVKRRCAVRKPERWFYLPKQPTFEELIAQGAEIVKVGPELVSFVFSNVPISHFDGKVQLNGYFVRARSYAEAEQIANA